MSYQPGDRLTQPIQATSRPESSRTSLTRLQILPSYGAYGCPEQQPFPSQDRNLQDQTVFSAETLRLQQPQQISPQQYPLYQGQAIYNIEQQAPSQLPHDPIPQYQQRHTAAVEVLSNQISLQQCYAPSEPANSIPTAQISFVTSQYEPMDSPPQTPASRSSLQQSYNVEMDYPPKGSASARELQQIMPSSDNMGEAYNRYHQQLKMTFKAISAGRLAEASVKIVNLSRWLLTNVAKLGLHQDEQNPQFEPIKVWGDFNICWLALGQKQKDLTEEAINYRISDSNFLPAEIIKAMVDELIRLCDSIEQYGLVDYDRGVWEEEITSIFSQCLDLLVPGEPSEAEQGYPSARPS